MKENPIENIKAAIIPSAVPSILLRDSVLGIGALETVILTSYPVTTYVMAWFILFTQ